MVLPRPLRPSLSAVVFDLDGTLVDSRPVWFAIVQDAAEHFGGPPVDHAVFERSFGQSTAADIQQFFPGPTVPEVDRFYAEAMVSHLHHLRRMDGALEILHRVHAAGLKCACATNSSRAFARTALELAGLLSSMDALACTDEVRHPKPAADLILLAAQRMGVPSTRCMVVGDSHFDMAAGRAAECLVVGLGVPGDERIESLRDLVELLEM